MFVILVRHADRVGENPDLSPAGRQRAETLAAMLAEGGIDAIFTSDAKRTKDTAKPLAAKLQLTPVVQDASATVAAAQVRAAGEIVLVVGHSDTVPELIAALDGPDVEIGPSEFNRMFIAEVQPTATHLLSLRYGVI
jgi:broad specificity phosphatase PhoE